VTITVDKAISHEKIFLSVTYVGTDRYDNLWSSAWGNTIILDIAPKEKSLPPCNSDREHVFIKISTCVILLDGSVEILKTSLVK
jgi:hypothetical protein